MMKLSFFALTITIASALGITAQVQRQKAETTPLDCAYYLLANNELEDTGGASITRTFFAVGRYDDALAASNLDNTPYLRPESLVAFGLKRIEAGDKQNARKFADSAFDEIKDDVDDWKPSDLSPLLKLLVATEQPDKAINIIDSVTGEDKFALLVALAKAYNEISDRQSALRTLDDAIDLPVPATNSGPEEYLLTAANLYIKLGAKSKAIEILDRLEQRVAHSERTIDPMELFRGYYVLGSQKQALAIWEKFCDKGDTFTTLQLSSVLIESKEGPKAEALLSEMTNGEPGTYGVGSEVVRQYIEMGKPDLAERFADRISSDPDNYDQQNAYVQIADYYIAAKRSAQAKMVLDKAFQKARQIKFEQEPQDSTSAGIRKVEYLKNISERLGKLGDIEKAIDVIKAIDDPHPIAKEDLVVGLAQFTKDHAKALGRKRAFQLFDEALSIAKSENEEFELIKVIALYAETCAILNDQKMATDLLVQMLQAQDYEGFALLSAGEVFDRYQLPSNDRIQSELSAILMRHDL